MFLDKLVIRNTSGVIREISFKKGLNLIVDETSSTTTDSGNNVGKTTFLRVIDFCLGGKKDDIYTDKEFKKKNKKIFEFLKNTSVEFELTLETKAGSKHTIIRPIDGKAKVDGIEQGSETKFKETLGGLLFGLQGGRPTLSQLMNKFIRIEEYQITNALYFLHNMSDSSEYESLFMFLFGFRNTELLSSKRKQVNELKKYKKNIDNFLYSSEDLEQQMHLIDKELSELHKIKKTFNFSKDVDKELARLKGIQGSVSSLKDQLAKANLKMTLNQEALEKLKSAKSKVNPDMIKSIYDQAKAQIPQLQTEFTEVLNFHNEMIDSKAKYIHGTLDKLAQSQATLNAELNSLLTEESGLISSMHSKGALNEYDKVSEKIQDRARDRGVKEGMLKTIRDLNSGYSKAHDELEKINTEIEKYAENFKESLKKFNEYFSDYSAKLYGDKYYLVAEKKNNKTTDNYLLEIGNMIENVGTGKKKAQISALDLAYLKFSEESKEALPLFMVHDQLETVFENQIETLFSFANSLTGQFVVAILSDKLHQISQNQVDENCILKLSQDNKLFKLS